MHWMHLLFSSLYYTDILSWIWSAIGWRDSLDMGSTLEVNLKPYIGVFIASFVVLFLKDFIGYEEGLPDLFGLKLSIIRKISL